ncbi:hypothetical protein [Devosia sp. MC521]|uniref:hypothetical protein n=1 Tax=Devosia sp. MC521 TaxID=2759954 RepID=UPI0015FCF65F|nr:hypothetical protein [Devosia sp. MC521]MBJ6987274.1 hypothetical protein [Devosia sp. MC521]QMW62882.1 hypothetical protein H4N61_00475 [Devosia sp. MC521]
MALSKTGVGQSQMDRTRQHLSALETQVRARIAATEARPVQAVSNRLHAARLYQDATHTRHAEVLRRYRAAQERLAAPEPRRSLTDRLLGRQPAVTVMETLEHEVAAARADLIAAEKAAAGADGNLARVEKVEAAERTQHMGQMETERRAALEMLAEIITAQRMVHAFPAFAYAGPPFVAWSGGKVERKRRRSSRNPWATNIWGIPLDFG